MKELKTLPGYPLRGLQMKVNGPYLRTEAMEKKSTYQKPRVENITVCHDLLIQNQSEGDVKLANT